MQTNNPRPVIRPLRSPLLRLRSRLRLLLPRHTRPNVPLLVIGLGLLCVGVAGCSFGSMGWVGGGSLGLSLVFVLGALSLGQVGCSDGVCLTSTPPAPTPTPTSTPGSTAESDPGATDTQARTGALQPSELRIEVSQRLISQGNLPPDVADALRQNLESHKRS